MVFLCHFLSDSCFPVGSFLFVFCLFAFYFSFLFRFFQIPSFCFALAFGRSLLFSFLFFLSRLVLLPLFRSFCSEVHWLSTAFLPFSLPPFGGCPFHFPSSSLPPAVPFLWPLLRLSLDLLLPHVSFLLSPRSKLRGIHPFHEKEKAESSIPSNLHPFYETRERLDLFVETRERLDLFEEKRKRGKQESVRFRKNR